MNKKRPVNLDIATIKLPITAYVSILHRASGVFLFAGVAVLLWMLDASLDSQEGFNSIGDLATNPVCQFVLWAVLAGLAYHMVLGIRHLIMDFGIGESLKGGQTGAKIALAIAIVLIVLAGGVGMVTSVTSFGRSGLYDWLIQRVGGAVMAAYTIFIVAYLACNPELTFEQWQSLYNQLWMRVFTLVTLLSFISHAWIGLWAVLTDYLTTRLLGSKATFLRIFAQIILGAVAVTYLVWGVQVIWGIN